MAYTVVFLVISAAGAPAPAPARLDALHDYGATRGLSFVPLSRGPTAGRSGGGLPAYDAGLVDRLEQELEQSRTALSSLEEAAAKERLARVEQELLAHPHLPQAAFLMAECLALQAQAAGATPAGDAWRAQRHALEGPRAPAFGEPVPAASNDEAPSVVLEGLAPADELEIDGRAQPGAERRASLLPGLHHFRVLRAGRPIFAAFRQVEASESSFTLEVPALLPCSHDDLAALDARLLAAGAPLPAGVACQRFAIVRPEARGVSVALCSQKGCGPLVHWQGRTKPAPFSPIPVYRSRLPRWAGFAIAGAGAALATSLVLWQSGALERGQRAAGTLRYDGLNP